MVAWKRLLSRSSAKPVPRIPGDYDGAGVPAKYSSGAKPVPRIPGDYDVPLVRPSADTGVLDLMPDALLQGDPLAGLLKRGLNHIQRHLGQVHDALPVL